MVTPEPHDPTRPIVCGHRNPATPKPVTARPGWWQNFATDCDLCNGGPSGIPYKSNLPKEANVRSKEEIRQQEGEASAVVCDGKTKVPGMTYEEGVAAALLWAIGDSDDKPMDD